MSEDKAPNNPAWNPVQHTEQNTKPCEQQEAPKCDCINTVLKNATDHILKHELGRFTNPEMKSSEWEYCTTFYEKRLYSNIIFKYTFEKANGSRSKVRNMHSSIYYSYCPFCGLKLKK